MALVGRFLRPIRVSLSGSICSSLSLSRNSVVVHGQSHHLRSWIKGLEPVIQNCVSRLHWKLNAQRIFATPGNMLKMGSIFGASVMFGSTTFRPCVAYAMDGLDILVDDHAHTFGTSELEEDPRVFWALTKKFWLPVVFFVTLLMNWDHPIVLAAKVILILLGTKPSPLSIYLFIEQLRGQIMLRDPLLYKFKPLHAKKVEVEDYKVLCLANVELRDQRFTLIGILGNWWVLPLSQFQGAISAFRSSLSNALNNY